MNDRTDNNSNKPSAQLTLPAIIILTLAAVGFAAGSAFDPFGVIGILLAVLSSAMLVALAAGARSVPQAFAVFINAPIAFIISTYIFTYVKSLPLENALVLSMAALYPSVMALPIWLTVVSGQGRSVSIAASAAASFVLWGGIVALQLQVINGGLSLEVLNEMIDATFAPARAALESLTYDHGDEVIRYYSDADIDSMLYTVKTLLIGSSAAVLIAVSYLTTLAARLIASCFELEGRFPASTCIRMKITPGKDGPTVELSKTTVPWRIELDSVSAFVLIGAYIFSILFATESNVGSSPTLPAAITAQNLMLILLPGFIYAGARDIFGNSGNLAGLGRGCVILPFSLVLVFINPLTLGLLLAIVGVTSVLRENRARSRAEHFLSNQNGIFGQSGDPAANAEPHSDTEAEDEPSADDSDDSDDFDENDNDTD